MTSSSITGTIPVMLFSAQQHPDIIICLVWTAYTPFILQDLTDARYGLDNSNQNGKIPNTRL
jgi:hypothetical protein